MTLHKEYTGAELHIPGPTAASDPGALGAGKMWIDSTDGTGLWLMKIRNVADDGWEEVGRTAIPAIPHYSKGTGELHIVGNLLHVYVTGPEDLWSMDISVFDLVKAIQGGAASPDLLFEIKFDGDAYTGSPSADPHAMTVTLDSTTPGTVMIWVQVVDDTTFAQAELAITVIVEGLVNGGGA